MVLASSAGCVELDLLYTFWSRVIISMGLECSRCSTCDGVTQEPESGQVSYSVALEQEGVRNGGV